MNTDQQRIRIAEAWGAFPGSINPNSWLGYFPVEHSETLYSLGYLTHDQMESDEKGGYTLAMTPNFPGDLNAMHEAEKTLTDEACQCYIDHLINVTKARDGFGQAAREDLWNHWAVYHATAAQRAEAFLRTVRAWVEG